MEINVKNSSGYYQTKETQITITNGDSFPKIIITIDEKGHLKIEGAGCINLKMPYKEAEGSRGLIFDKESKDTINVLARLDGMEGGLDVVVSSSDKLLERTACIVLSKEDDKTLIKMRDGLGSWTKEFSLH